MMERRNEEGARASDEVRQRARKGRIRGKRGALRLCLCLINEWHRSFVTPFIPLTTRPDPSVPAPRSLSRFIPCSVPTRRQRLSDTGGGGGLSVAGRRSPPSLRHAPLARVPFNQLEPLASPVSTQMFREEWKHNTTWPLDTVSIPPQEVLTLSYF